MSRICLCVCTFFILFNFFTVSRLFLSSQILHFFSDSSISARYGTCPIQNNMLIKSRSDPCRSPTWGIIKTNQFTWWCFCCQQLTHHDNLGCGWCGLIGLTERSRIPFPLDLVQRAGERPGTTCPEKINLNCGCQWANRSVGDSWRFGGRNMWACTLLCISRFSTTSFCLCLRRLWPRCVRASHDWIPYTCSCSMRLSVYPRL